MLLSAIAQLPGIRRLLAPLRRRRARRRFAHQYAAFFGVYASRAEAETAVDLLIASGSLQYLDDPLQVVREAGTPRHVLVNRLPLGGMPTFWTLQNGGAVFYAQRVQTRVEFLAAMTALGYRVVDEWEDRVDRCEIPLHPERSLETYAGFYFRRD